MHVLKKKNVYCKIYLRCTLIFILIKFKFYDLFPLTITCVVHSCIFKQIIN